MKPSIEVLRDIHLREIQNALFYFQMIEEGLKTYVSKAHEVIQCSLPSELVFRSDPREYENAPLERLIKLFAKVTRNEDLVDRLSKLLKPRNYCAHRAYALAFLSKVRPGVDMKAEVRKAAEAGSAAEEIFFELQAELEGIASLKSRVSMPRMSDLARK
jgi:hypothetical protein